MLYPTLTNGTVRSVKNHAHAPPHTLLSDKTTTPPSNHKLFETNYTPGMGATRLRPTVTESHVDALTVDQPSRLRVIAKALTPITSRTQENKIDCPWCLRTAPTRGAQQDVWPHGTRALRKYLEISKRSPENAVSIQALICAHLR